MKGIIISILTLLGLVMFVHSHDSLADEVVFCVSQESQSAVLTDAEGLCAEGENEYVISGSGITISEDFVPLAVFSDNENCDEGSTGTTTQVGFDENEDGTLGTDEVMAISGSCSPTS